ncbi:hypothetical protein SAMN06295945_1867 [Polynucleobacter meluiroseus]|uniref:Uncharacterized protein n=1 Tax=Polynucleobacter meluiroseus TaxID=1938814 RepID=A0A240E3N8_9BURK|nr:hypothetical protein SAMN06295945_1867 [Polynucleobacter meluiroseus]
MGRITNLIEMLQTWLFRAGVYASNTFLDDPALLAFAFC